MLSNLQPKEHVTSTARRIAHPPQKRIAQAVMRLLDAGEVALALPLIESEQDGSASLGLLYGVAAVSMEDWDTLESILCGLNPKEILRHLPVADLGNDPTGIGLGGVMPTLYLFLASVSALEQGRTTAALGLLHRSWDAWCFYTRAWRPFSTYSLHRHFTGLPRTIAELAHTCAETLGFSQESRTWDTRVLAVSHVEGLSWYNRNAKVEAEVVASDEDYLEAPPRQSLVSVCIPTTLSSHLFQLTLAAIVAHAGHHDIEILFPQTCLAGIAPADMYSLAYQHLLRPIGAEGDNQIGLRSLLHAAEGEYVVVLGCGGIPSDGFIHKILHKLENGGSDIISIHGVRSALDGQDVVLVADSLPLDLTVVLNHAELANFKHIASDLDLSTISPYYTSQFLPFGIASSRTLVLELINCTQPLNTPLTLCRFFGIIAHLRNLQALVVPEISFREVTETVRTDSKIVAAYEALIVGFIIYDEGVFQERIVPSVQAYAGDYFNTAWSMFASEYDTLKSVQKTLWQSTEKVLDDWWSDVASRILAALPLNQTLYLSRGALQEILQIRE